MNNELKQLEFHRDAKITESKDDDENVLKFRRLFRDKFSKFVEEHSQSNTGELAKASLKEVWTLVKRLELERVWGLEATPDPNDEKPYSKSLSSPRAETNEKTRADRYEEESDFVSLDTREFKSSDITEVSFRQKYHGIPVYDSLSVVEVDREKKEIISIHSSLIEKIENDNEEVDHEPKFKEEQIKDLIQKKKGVRFDRSVDLDPKLFYYFDSDDEKWRLVYITATKIKDNVEPDYINMVNYIVDAHSGEIIGEQPRMRSLMALD
jgi:Zn-dependent metalloprotease